MKQILVTLLWLLPFLGYTQGVGYVNYKSYKTHYGNGASSTYNGVTYAGLADDAAELDAMLDTSQPGTTLTHTGFVLANSNEGFIQGKPPKWWVEYFAISHSGWFQVQTTGTYKFSIGSDDGSAFYIDGILQIFRPCCGYTEKSIALTAGVWYQFETKWQEYGGGDYMNLRYQIPNSSQWVTMGANASEITVTNIINEPTKKAIVNFNFGSTLDETKFLASSLVLNSSGQVNITNALDSNKIATGNKATIAVSNWESVIINPYESSRGGHRLMLDERMFNSSSPKFNSINSIKILDIYDGSVTVYDTSGWWKTYIIPGNIASKITSSTYQNSLRLQDGWYAIQAGTNITFEETTVYKTQLVTMNTTNTLSTLYNSILTVSDVYLAFKELANGGIFGNQTGNEFGYGIQYKNADVNDDNIFNEADCFALLQHLTGAKNIVDTFNLRKTLKLIPQSTYNTIGKSNWGTFSSYLGDSILLNINTGKAIDTFNISAAWKGDVNLSHSATPSLNGVINNSVVKFKAISISNEINASIITEIAGDSIYAYITLDPLQQQLVGTQFQLNYDNTLLKFSNVTFKTKGNPTNYAANKGDYINVGSLISDGSTTLDNTTEYKVSFTSTTKLDNILGLMSIDATDAVNKDGVQLRVKVK